jgi:predicted amidohydrolase YtcJ
MRFPGRVFALLVSVATVFLAACSGPDGGSGDDDTNIADYLFSNGKVYTVTDRQPWAEAVALRGNKILFVGSTVEAVAFANASTEIIDLAGKMLLPGFISGHDHLVTSGWISQELQLDGEKSGEEYTELLRNYAAASAAGITSVLNPAVITPNANEPELMFTDYRLVLELLRELDRRGELKLRSFVQPVYNNGDTDIQWFTDQSADFASGYNSDRLRSFGIKVHPGGTWTSRTALQLEPYADSAGNVGTANMQPSLLNELVLAANAKGLDVIAHVEGSAMARAAVDAIEASIRAGNMQARNALHHLSWVHPQDLLRIMALHLTVNVTPLFGTDWDGRNELAKRLLGEERSRRQMSTYPLLFNNGNRVSLSADVPGSPLERIGPLFNMQAAMTLRDPSNPESRTFPPGRKGISLHHAIKGVTLFPAWQVRMEDKLGTIEAGKYADLVILEKNLFGVAPEDIAAVRVVGTLMDGKFSYRDGI